MTEERKQHILTALVEELERQAGEDRRGHPRLNDRGSERLVGVEGDIDLIALATAIDARLGGDALEVEGDPAAPLPAGPPGPGASPKGAYAKADEGKTPDQLNASNDE
jgi:hypothetical protein